MQRRNFIVAGGAATTTLLAGCTGSDDDEEENGGDEGDEEEPAENGDADEEEENGEEGEHAEFIDEADDQIELEYGEEAEHSNGMIAIAHGLEFEDQLGDFDEPDQGQFALLEFEARNEGDEAERTPSAWQDIVLLHDNNQYDSEFVSDMGGREEYDDGEIQPDVTREGYIAFDVPGDLDEGDLDTLWHDDFLGANIDVRWTASQ